MKAKFKNINDYTKELTCSVDWSNLKDSFSIAFEKIKSNHTPEGGRKGKVFGVHLEIFKKNYTPAIEAKFAEDSLNQYYRQAVDSEGLNPISQANVSKLDFSEGNKLEFVLSFEVIPDIKLPNYKKKFKIELTRYIQSEDDVNMSMEELRQQHSNIKTVDDGAQSGNFIMGDFQELDENDIPIIGKKLDKQYIKLGVGAFIGSAEKQLIGIKAGEKKKVTVDYGEGKSARYEIDIHKVEEQILPEVGDDFAKTVSPELKSLSELKEKLKESIQNSIDDDYEKRKREEIINYFITKSKFSPPESMIKRYVDKLIEEQEANNKNSNVDPEKLKEQAKKAADYNVKWYLIKDKLISEMKISFLDNDIEKEIDKIIKESKDDEKKIREFFSDENNRSSLESNLLNQNLFDSLYEFVNIKEIEKSTSELKKQK